MLAWLDQVELDDAIAAAYNANLSMAAVDGAALAQTTGTGKDAQITFDTKVGRFREQTRDHPGAECR